MSDIHFLDSNGLLYLWSKIKTLLGGYVVKENGKSLISDAEITRLASVINYDDTNIQSAISTLEDKVEALEAGTYDDTQLRQDIADTYATITSLTAHTSDITIHVTAADKAAWNAKQDALTIDTELSTSSTNPVRNSAVATAINGKVDKVSGKGLSTNDYTTTEKSKLSGIAEGAQVNVIETINVNGTAVTPSSKTVSITVPTNNNQLTNGAGYQTASDVNTIVTGYGYQTASDVSTAISDALDDITGITYEVVQALPATGVSGTIYLLSNSGSNPNIYDEFIYVNDAFEKIGTTDVDLSGYAQYSDKITNAEIDTICV